MTLKDSQQTSFSIALSKLSTSVVHGIQAASTRPLNAATFAVLWEHHSYHPTLHASKMTLAKAEGAAETRPFKRTLPYVLL